MTGGTLAAGVGRAARKAAKAAVLPAGVGRGRRPGDVVILLYHRVTGGRREIDLPPARFEQQLAWLAANDRVLRIDGVVDDAAGGGVVLSFDDGTRDFTEVVLPLLVRYRTPAVLYLVTGAVDRGAAGDLSWGQLEEAVASGLVTIGSHTHTHADLSKATAAQAEEEMRRSKRLVEERLGVPCRHFAYPWSVGSPLADHVARRLFDSAALDAWRTNRRGAIDPFRLGRVPVLRSDGMRFFRAKAHGALDAEGMLYRALGRGPWRRT